MCKIVVLVVVLAVVVSLYPPFPAAASSDFPIPEQIKKNVEFWKKVYAWYSSNHVIIHDVDHLDVVYQVVDLNDFYPEETDLRTKWKKVEKIKEEYRDILIKLAGVPVPIDTTALGEHELRVLHLWQKVDDTDKFKNAAQRLRGQMGQRDKFQKGLERSGLYLNKIQEIFGEYGLPQELCYLPHVESSFYYKAYSKMGAAGRKFVEDKYNWNSSLNAMNSVYAMILGEVSGKRYNSAGSMGFRDGA